MDRKNVHHKTERDAASQSLALDITRVFDAIIRRIKRMN